MSTHAQSTSIVASASGINDFVIALVTPRVWQGDLEVIFVAFLMLGLVCFWFSVPKTKGKTLEETDQVFGAQMSYEDRGRLGSVQREVSLFKVSSRPYTRD